MHTIVEQRYTCILLPPREDANHAYNTIATQFCLSVCMAVRAVGDTVATSHKRGIPSSYVYIGGQLSV